MSGRPVVEVVRDCAATTVPFGVPTTLAASERVQVVQRLGASITVQTARGSLLRADATRALLAVPGVDEAAVELVWDPPWSIDRMSEETRLEPGLL